jgi:hypothetical protein
MMIIANLVGILAGLYFQVVILVPLTLGAIIYCDVAAMSGGQSFVAALCGGALFGARPGHRAAGRLHDRTDRP